MVLDKGITAAVQQWCCWGGMLGVCAVGREGSRQATDTQSSGRLGLVKIAITQKPLNMSLKRKKVRGLMVTVPPFLERV
ncbi:hypothetical protein J6590_047927 [Homalodisca vitripennis]|nr:hypothetical protein J6590_047927 [Homalodisca vitripennis]